MIKLLKPIVFFDLETTGTSISTDRICQIGITKVFPDGTSESKSFYVNPQMPIPKEATNVHGITDEMVKDAPTFARISKALKEKLADSDIGGYNSDNFDIPLLSQEFSRCEIDFPDEGTNTIDVYKVEKIVNSHKLGETYKRYTGTELENSHDASVDTEATRIVFEHQMKRLIEVLGENIENFDGNVTTELIDIFCQGDEKRFDFAGKTYEKDGVVYWSFGKCMNKPVLDDRGYLNWVLSNDFPIETKRKLKSLLIEK